MGRPRRTWRQFQDEKAIREAAMKRERESTETPIVQELRKAGDIKEAAVVFSHEGFYFLLENLGGVVAEHLETKLNQLLDKKLTELIEGFNEGLHKAIEDYTSAQAQKVQAVIEEKAERVSQGIERTEGSELIPNYNMTYSGYVIPMANGIILWGKMSKSQEMEVILHYIDIAHQKGWKDVPSFRRNIPRGNGIYQRICRLFGKGAWSKVKQIYESELENIRRGVSYKNDKNEES